MPRENRVYLAIDLKSFYASVECVERGLDPMTTNLVVADSSRTEKTICLAVSPALKAYGLAGRARLFEVVERVREINRERLSRAPGHAFIGSSCDDAALRASPKLELAYLTATPRMAHYIEYSTRIYSIYLKYIAPEDIHVYSIDEVFIDATRYLDTYRLDGRGLAKKLLLEILQATGLPATAGIGTNLYLCKVAMDILAKHVKPDADGVRIAELDEASYRRQLWTHRPLTDFWRVGRGYASRLEQHGLYTMGDIARCSLGAPQAYYNENLLHKLFGVNAELLIDHAWGWEPCTIADIKAYKPASNSIGSGQVLQCPYEYGKARLIVREMAELLVLELVDKGLVTDQIILTVGYDAESLKKPEIRKNYKGPVTKDFYGRRVPKHAHGTANLGQPTASTKRIVGAAMELYGRIVNPALLVRRVTITAGRVVREEAVPAAPCEQLSLFVDYTAELERRAAEEAALARERSMQRAILDIKHRFGKNAILKGMNLEKGATTVERNRQIGGHKA